jgi:hypothetical protein
MALPTYVASGTYAEGTGAIVPGLPAGHTTDDILVLQVETNGNQPASAPSGWTQFPNSPQDEAVAGGICLAAFWKRHDGSETAPTVADTGNHQSAFIAAYRGVRNTGNPYDEDAGASAGNIDASADTAFDSATITTTEADCMVVCFAAHGLDGLTAGNFGTPSNSDLANVAERHDDSTSSGSGGGIALFDGEKASAGSVGAFTSTLGSSAPHASIVVALVGVSDGGTEHEQPVDDSVSVSDSLAFERAITVADTAGVTDALSFERAISIADTLGLSDALAFMREIVVADTVGVADNLNAERGIEQPVDDTLGLADETLRETGKGVSVDDTVGIADAFSFERILALEEAVGLTDAQAFERQIVLTDTVGLADALAFAFDLHMADALGLADDIQTAEGTGHTVTVDDTVTISDLILPELNPEEGEVAHRVIRMREGLYSRTRAVIWLRGGRYTR